MKSLALLLCSFCLFSSISFAADAVGREITVAVQAPDTTWSLAVERVVEVEKELWVIAQLKQAEGMMGAMVITDLTASVTVKAPEIPVKVFVTGKTWNWGENDGNTYLKNLKSIQEKLDGGVVLHPQAQN